MGDDKIKPLLNIDPQPDFNAAAAGDGITSTRIKDYLKGIDFKKIMDEMPLKKIRNEEKIWPGMDMSGSMDGIYSHEIPHKIYEKPLEKNYSEKFNKKHIIIFDEISDTGKKSFSDAYHAMMGILDEYNTSQARGRELAETCHQGIAQAVSVRRPVTFRARFMA